MSLNNIDIPENESSCSATSSTTRLSLGKQEDSIDIDMNMDMDMDMDMGMSERAPRRRSSTTIVRRSCRTDTRNSIQASGSTTHRRSSSSFSLGKKDGSTLTDENDIRANGTGRHLSQRRSSTVVFCRRYSLLYKEKGIAAGNSDDMNRTVTTTMGTSGRTTSRRCSLFFEEKDIDNTNDRLGIDNDGEDNLDIDVFEDVFNDINADIFDDNLSPIKDHWKSFAKRERNLSLAMSFDMKSFFSPDEETRRAKRERNLSLTMNVDIKPLFSSDEENRRASITFTKLLTEELDNANVAQVLQPHENPQEKEQLSPAVSSTDPLPFFTGNLATYYMMIQDNLCEAMVKSEKTRLVVEKMNEAVFRKAPQLKEYLKRTVFKRSQPRKYVLCRR